MSVRNVQRRAAARYSELGADLSSTLHPPKPKHRTSDLPTTTRLLRNSRLFSLPKPLERPSQAQAYGIRSTQESDTSTLPYPTHAAIVTHQSGLGRGDWGLKRALPARAFKTTTPIVRIRQVDSIDHITEFESAADHVFTLQKVQEMNIPILLPKRERMQMPGGWRNAPAKESTSAFEEFADPKDRPKKSIAAGEDNTSKLNGWGVDIVEPEQVRRWHYDAPWIAGMQPGDFESYVKSTIKNKRGEFREWLRKKLAEEQTQKQAPNKQSVRNLDAGIGLESEPEATRIASDIAEELVPTSEVPAKDTIEEEILNLRSADPRRLNLFIWEFLDLPGRFPSPAMNLNQYAEDNVDVEQGPPSTHPSAGLSYLRPVQQLYNHPALGPLAMPPPVQARLLQRPGMPRGRTNAVWGVGGIAVENPSNNIGSNDTGSGPATTLHSLKIVGGHKAWVRAHDAVIDSKGRIKLDITNAHQDEVDVWNPNPVESSTQAPQKRSWGSRSLSSSSRMPDLAPMPNYKKIPV